MKTLFKLLTALLLMSMGLIGCDDDDEKLPENYIQIQGKTYELAGGAIINVGQDEWHKGFNTDLAFYSKGLTVDDEMELTGEGEIVFFEMYSTQGVVLNNAQYEYSQEEPYEIGTISSGEYYYYIEDSEEDDVIHEITSGIVSVQVIGDKYTITINCEGSDKEIITGQYSGELHLVDASVYQEDDEYAKKQSIKTKKRNTKN